MWAVARPSCEPGFLYLYHKAEARSVVPRRVLKGKPRTGGAVIIAR